MRMFDRVPGTLIAGKYRVERVLGSGGMGVVVEATHAALGQRVAIKLLSPEFADAPEVVARFFREARISAKLDSEHVVRVTDFGQTEAGMPFLVMEMLVGHDLSAELAHKQRLAIPEAVDLALQACEGMAHAHAAGLVHRDLKPGNLFLVQRPGRRPLLKVLDFGISKEPGENGVRSLTQENTVLGTPHYMSPEQVMSSKKVDARTDQHALAVILFEMLTGTMPYDGDTPTQVLVAVATHRTPRVRERRPDLPPGLDAAIARALDKDAAQRFPDVAAFAEAIAPFGGPLAQEMAPAVRAALSPRVTPVPAPGGGSLPSHEALTVPRELSAPVLPAYTAETLATTLMTSRRSRYLPVFVAGALGAVAGGIVIARYLAENAPPPAASAPEVLTAPAVEPAAKAAPTVSPGDPAPAGSGATASDSPAPSPAAGASAGSAAKAPRTTASPASASSRGSHDSSLIQHFGKR